VDGTRREIGLSRRFFRGKGGVRFLLRFFRACNALDMVRIIWGEMLVIERLF